VGRWPVLVLSSVLGCVFTTQYNMESRLSPPSIPEGFTAECYVTFKYSIIRQDISGGFVADEYTGFKGIKTTIWHNPFCRDANHSLSKIIWKDRERKIYSISISDFPTDFIKVKIVRYIFPSPLYHKVLYTNIDSRRSSNILQVESHINQDLAFIVYRFTFSRGFDAYPGSIAGAKGCPSNVSSFLCRGCCDACGCDLFLTRLPEPVSREPKPSSKEAQYTGEQHEKGISDLKSVTLERRPKLASLVVSIFSAFGGIVLMGVAGGVNKRWLLYLLIWSGVLLMVNGTLGLLLGWDWWSLMFGA